MNHVIFEYQTKKDRMVECLGKVKELFKSFEWYTITQISIKENSKADVLARLASATDTSLTKHNLIDFLPRPSICQGENNKVNLVDIGRS